MSKDGEKKGEESEQGWGEKESNPKSVVPTGHDINGTLTNRVSHQMMRDA
jgi:hypothetical protein